MRPRTKGLAALGGLTATAKTGSAVVVTLRKFVRYARLYGAARTVAKTRGHLHAGNGLGAAARLRKPVQGERHVGILGCGRFAFSTLAYFLEKNHGPVIRGVMDIDPARAASLGRHYGALYHTRDVDRILADPSIDIVFIAANHASHAAYAIRALEAGKHVHLEKPHALSIDELTDLCRAMARARGRLRLGFNRRESPAMAVLKAHIGRQEGAASLDWFVVGHRLAAEHWYHARGEGGHVLGNLCHWTDALLQLIGEADRYPVRIVPVHTEALHRSSIVSFRFGDGSVATITFTARGATFEGVRERLNGQRGDLVFFLEDFQRAQFCINERTVHWRSRLRDLGHEAAVGRSYALTGRQEHANAGCTVRDVWETARFYLATKAALDAGTSITLHAAEAHPAADPPSEANVPPREQAFPLHLTVNGAANSAPTCTL